jgi:hypothetical protein
MTRRLVPLSALLSAAILTGWAAPAAADLTDPPGTCTGTATWSGGGFTVDSATADPAAVIEVPRADDVAWTARAVGPVAGEPRPISGSVTLSLPAPFGSVTIDEWQSTSVNVESAGTYAYDLPALVPAGVVFEVRAEHHENGPTFCTAAARLRIAGGPGLPAWLGLVLTLVAAVLLGLTGVTSGAGGGSGIGRSVGGAILGLFTGWLLGLDLVLFGATALDSALPVVLAGIGLVGGAVWSRLAPIHRGPST